jgi:hypothetical protein
MVYEITFDLSQNWMKSLLRKILVKAPWPILVFKNWRKVREYL